MALMIGYRICGRYWFAACAVIAGLGLMSVASASSVAGGKPATSGTAREAATLPTDRGHTGHPDAPGDVLVAHTTWQGISQPNTRNTTQTLTLTLRLVGGGPLVQYGNVATDAGGFITVSVDTLPAGTYNYQAKGYRNLAQGGQVSLGGGPITNLEMSAMEAGDALNDNVVNATDFVVLRSTFGHRLCFDFGCRWDPRPDFDNTDVVNSTDFTLLKGNYGIGGAPPVGP